jgi:hypothetical protein
MSTGKHRTTWTADRFRADLLKSMLIASGKRVDLTKGYRK